MGRRESKRSKLIKKSRNKNKNTKIRNRNN